MAMDLISSKVKTEGTRRLLLILRLIMLSRGSLQIRLEEKRDGSKAVARQAMRRRFNILYFKHHPPDRTFSTPEPLRI
jgi:hypothetical protein